MYHGRRFFKYVNKVFLKVILGGAQFVVIHLGDNVHEGGVFKVR